MPRTVLGLTSADWLGIGAAVVLLQLAFPPFHLLVPAFVCLVPVLVPFLHPGAARRHVVRGFCYGFLGHAVLLSWMPLALWRFKPAATAAFLIVPLGYGLTIGAAFGFAAWVLQRTRLPLPLVIAVTWTAVDWLAGHLGFLAIPWLGLGTALSAFPLLIQIADVGGARGLAFLLAMANGVLAVAWHTRRQPRRAVARVAAVAIGAALVAAYGSIRLGTLVRRPVGMATVVQPNIAASVKWDATRQDEVVRNTLSLSRDAALRRPATLLVWPELALPVPLYFRPEWELLLERHARQARALLLAGAMQFAPTNEGEGGRGSYNSVYLFGRGMTSLARSAVYRKERLVPVFERFNGTSPGRHNVPVETPVARLGVLICHEAAFEQLARARRRDGAEVLVNLANDGWFTGTFAARQHAAHLVMRAVETRTGVVRADNVGPSGFIDPLGLPHAWIGEGVAATVTDTLWVSDTTPPYVRLGDWVGLLSAVTVVATALILPLRSRPTDPARSLPS